MPNIILVHADLPANLPFPTGMVAIDTETTGLSLQTDKLCLAQVSDGMGNVWLVKFDGQNYAAPNLKAMLQNPRLTKLFHFARFDLAMLQKHLSLPEITPTFCTKIASKLVRPTEGKHNLRTLVELYCGVLLDKGEQMSNWAAEELTESQKQYAASDVLYLHQIHQKLTEQLTEKNLNHTMHQALQFLPTRVQMDLLGLPETDLFSHH
ncbi:MAG: ribonuclease D [Proteobacteria bacterium]|nr:ribonuclease D [Pseudomonadota bacterium]NBX85885.1 ribonuclease D [Pseudomonadota bacterium]